MHVQQRIDEQPAAEICGVGADLAAVIVELAHERVVFEIALHETAEKAEDQRIAGRPEIPLGHVETDLQVHDLKVAVEIEIIGAPVSARGGAVIAVEPGAGTAHPDGRRQLRLCQNTIRHFAGRVIGRGGDPAIEQHAQIGGAVEPRR